MNTKLYISTHEEWLKSLRDDDGRKWLTEEAADGTAQYWEKVEEYNPYANCTGNLKKGRGSLRHPKGWQSKEGRGYTWRLSYNRLVGQYTGDAKYPQLSGSSVNRKKKPSRPGRKPDREVLHILSTRSRGKVRDKATAFYRSAGKDRVFMTLTFIEHVTDQVGVRILNKFLTVLRKEKPALQYLWVAEHQPDRKERTVHFHMIVNCRIPIRRYNALWVLQQYNAGLRGHRADGSEICRQEIEDRYMQGSVGKVLNPVDVCRAHGVNALAGYLTKYITKQKKEEFRCLNWHCSRKVSQLFTRQVVSPSTFKYLQHFGNYRVDYKTGECSPAWETAQPFFRMITVNNRNLVVNRMGLLETVNRWIMQKDLIPDLLLIDNEYYRQKIFDNDIGPVRKKRFDLQTAGR